MLYGCWGSEPWLRSLPVNKRWHCLRLHAALPKCKPCILSVHSRWDSLRLHALTSASVLCYDAAAVALLRQLLSVLGVPVLSLCVSSLLWCCCCCLALSAVICSRCSCSIPLWQLSAVQLLLLPASMQDPLLKIGRGNPAVIRIVFCIRDHWFIKCRAGRAKSLSTNWQWHLDIVTKCSGFWKVNGETENN